MANAIPETPTALLRRKVTAEALTAAGFPISEKTLATKAVRGGGPPYQTFGRTVLYRWGAALAWAEERLSPPRCSTSEADPHRRQAA
jgi:hypothetical protein